MEKRDFREHYKKLRLKLSREEIDQKSTAIANQLLKLPLWEGHYFHIFLPIEEQNEVNTEMILPLLKGKDKNIVVSKTDFLTKKMTHFLLTDDLAFKKNNYGIPEPENGLEVPVSKLDVVLVPLFIFDRNGHRVGYGGGFYDKFLSECNPKTKTVGLSFFPPTPEIKDVHASDVPLDFGVTPERVYYFNK